MRSAPLPTPRTSRERFRSLLAKLDESEEEMDEDEREARRLEALLDKRLVLAGDVIKEDVWAFALLAAVQALPVLGSGLLWGNFAFFWTNAVLSVYLGAKRASAVDKAGKVFNELNLKNAVAAPVAASLSLFGMYYLLKDLHLDIGTIYQLMTTFFGWVCLTDVLASGALALGIAGPTTTSAVLSQAEGDVSTEGVGKAKAIGGVIAAAVCAMYLWASGLGHGGIDAAATSPITTTALLLAANFITTGIAIQAQTTISLKSLRPALLFLVGLFLYDVYWVFLAPGQVMESVATSVEGPVKFLSPRATAATGQYPFSILGLGDVVVPGVFVGLLKKLDDSLKACVSSTTTPTRTAPPPPTRKPLTTAAYTTRRQPTATRTFTSSTTTTTTRTTTTTDTKAVASSANGVAGNQDILFTAGLSSYAVGLLLTFVANVVSARGQPALLYIVPCLIIGALGAAGATGRWDELWGFGEGKDEADAGIFNRKL